MKKKTKDVPRWSGWTLPDGTEVPPVPCGSVFKGKKEKVDDERKKELREIRKEYL